MRETGCHTYTLRASEVDEFIQRQTQKIDRYIESRNMENTQSSIFRKSDR